MTATLTYDYTLAPLVDAPPILADFPEFVEPLPSDRRFLAGPLVDDQGGALLVRSWRYCYNVRGIVEMENRLDARATAVVMVHPWGVDDGHGLKTPEPAGVALFCTPEKNAIGLRHAREVVNPFLTRLRGEVALTGYSLPAAPDPIRGRLYASIDSQPSASDAEEGERILADLLRRHDFSGHPLPATLDLDPALPLRSYFAQADSTDASDFYNGAGFWELPMPIETAIEYHPGDLVFYDGEGYAGVRDYLKCRGVRHILLVGYCTDMCVARTTCGYENFCRDFNLFLVGDATLATFPGSATPKYATQVALANAALSQMVTQVNWVRIAK